MVKCLQFAFGILMVFVLSVCAAAAATGGDTLGIIGNALSTALSKIKFPAESIIAIVGVLSMIAYRGVQILLQILPTKWKWINNKYY
jgi:xanthosine utilization system XapX-like protein